MSSQTGKQFDGNQLWHTDSSFKPIPAKYAVLSAREAPDAGGETEFASARAAFAGKGGNNLPLCGYRETPDCARVVTVSRSAAGEL